MAIKIKRKSLEVGSMVLNNKYEVLKVIHTSGMANVYLVSDKSLNKQWCLKEIIKSEAGKNMVEYRSLLQEANIMKSLNHSSIPRIVTIEEEGDSIFIVMDYVDGLSIKDWLLRKGSVTQSVAVNWMKQVCGVLIYLHNRKHPIFYRDMKPDNIMIQEDGNIKVLDFGISVVLTSKEDCIKEALGTKGYAAPEQKKRGNRCDLRSDIFALGRTMYHMLTGLNPSIIGEENLKPIREINSSLSMGLEVIIDKCTRQDPNERYQTVEEVLYALKNYETLDSSYRNKAKRKVNIAVGCFIGSALFFAGSFIPLGLHKSEISSVYEKNLEVAIQTSRTSDYVNAIKYKPLLLEPYEGLIDSFKVDGVFSKEEEIQLLGLVNPNLTDMKKNKEYGKLAFNIGKLYWFYYEGDDGDTVSSKWFKEALDKGYNEKEAKVFYDLGSFKKNISMSIAESSDSGMYIKYWNNLIGAKGIDSGEIVELQLYTSIADAISSYSYRLRVDGVSKEDLLKEISNISDFLAVSNPISDKSKELHTKLSSIVGTLRDKVEVAYSIGGVE